MWICIAHCQKISNALLMTKCDGKTSFSCRRSQLGIRTHKANYRYWTPSLIVFLYESVDDYCMTACWLSRLPACCHAGVFSVTTDHTALSTVAALAESTSLK